MQRSVESSGMLKAKVKLASDLTGRLKMLAEFDSLTPDARPIKDKTTIPVARRQ